MLELQHKLWRRYRIWVQRMMERASAERGIEIDTKRAALTYAQMVDSFWLGWLMDRDVYEPDDAYIIIRDWRLDLFAEQQASHRSARKVASKTAARNALAARPRAKKISARKT